MTYAYDGTFDGLLTVIFECYDRKMAPIAIQRPGQRQEALFERTELVPTEPVKADRVWAGLGRVLSLEARQNFYYAFLAEVPEVELLLYRFARKAFASALPIEQNYADPDVLQVQRLARRVWREKHRMEAFVRFQKTADGLYMALIAPDYNVLPLVSGHFEARYADQAWVIYDSRRHYGLHYDQQTVQEVHLDENLFKAGSTQLPAVALDAAEQKFQQLWQAYFSSVNIPERKNLKLHLRHLPKRYWRYLSEKQPRGHK